MKSIFPIILWICFSSIWAENLLSYEGSLKKDPRVFSNEYIERIDSNYIVGPGDNFEIVFNNSSNPFQVGAEGYLSINGIPPIYVSDLPLFKAKALIIKKLGEEYPQTQIGVNLFKKRKISVTILGYVIRTDKYQVDNLSSILELIHKAQGFEKNADQQNIILVRNNDTTHINIFDLIRGGDISKNLPLLDGDFVYVPKVALGDSLIYYNLNGAYYGMPLDNPPQSLYFYIDRLDFLQSGNIQSLIIRNPLGTREYTMQQAKQVFPTLGDTIDTKAFYTDVFVGGAVQHSAPQKYNPDLRPIEYIYNAGTSVMADQLDRIRVVRQNGTFEYIDPIKGQIYPGDYIELDISALDYAAKWTPILSTILGAASLIWTMYYTTIWYPNHN